MNRPCPVWFLGSSQPCPIGRRSPLQRVCRMVQPAHSNRRKPCVFKEIYDFVQVSNQANPVRFLGMDFIFCGGWLVHRLPTRSAFSWLIPPLALPDKGEPAVRFFALSFLDSKPLRGLPSEPNSSRQRPAETLGGCDSRLDLKPCCSSRTGRAEFYRNPRSQSGLVRITERSQFWPAAVLRSVGTSSPGLGPGSRLAECDRMSSIAFLP